jgi:hypothetical protein
MTDKEFQSCSCLIKDRTFFTFFKSKKSMGLRTGVGFGCGVVWGGGLVWDLTRAKPGNYTRTRYSRTYIQ